MDSNFLNFYSKFSKLNVSRETCNQFENFVSLIQDRNHRINLISKKHTGKKLIRERHIIDSAQIIDFIDLNSNTTSDLGSGAGFPGLIIAILLKRLNSKIRVNLYEKSFHKSIFLSDASRKLDLNTKVIRKDIFVTKNIETGTIMSRAFKPLPVILELVTQNFKKYKNLILFMGSNGRKVFRETLKEWELDYEEKKSITNEESFLLNIKKIKKKLI